MTDNTFTSPGKATFTSRDEAIAYIIEYIEADGTVADARSKYDIDAIADELILVHADQTPDGAIIATSVYFYLDSDVLYRGKRTRTSVLR